LAHNISGLNTPVSSVVIDILCSRSNVYSGSISFGHYISSCCLFRSTFIWEERIRHIKKILKSNIDNSTIALAHYVSSFYSPISSVIVDVLCSGSNINSGSISLGHNISSCCYFRSPFVWKERIRHIKKILKSNIDASTISTVHYISSGNTSISISVIKVVCRSSNIDICTISLVHNITCLNYAWSSNIGNVRIKIKKSNMDFVSISHWCESVGKIDLLVGSIVLRSNLNVISISICLEFISNWNDLLLSWNNSKDRSGYVSWIHFFIN